MTVCIAAKADDGKSLVLAADQMATMPHLIAENESAHKILELANNIYLLTAGSEFNARKIYNLTVTNSKKRPITTVGEAVFEVLEAYKQIRLVSAEDTFLTPRGFKDIKDYLNQHPNLNNNVVALIDQQMTNPKFFNESYIVAGVNPSGKAEIFIIQSPGQFGEVSDFIAIGSGQAHASNSLYARGYTQKQTLKEATYLVFESKKRSEIAPGVGVKTDMIIMSKTKAAKNITEKELDGLNNLYKDVVDSERNLLKTSLINYNKD